MEASTLFERGTSIRGLGLDDVPAVIGGNHAAGTCRTSRYVRLTLRTELRGGSGAEADAARRSPPLTSMRVRTA
jgi:hypothetical protein